MTDTMMGRMARIEEKLDSIIALLGGSHGPTMVDMPALTTKQHAALQMLVRGASNDEIARRFGVSVNTAKVYVRGLFAKFEVNTRSALAAKTVAALAGTDDQTYRALSGGLPSAWDAEFVEPDPYEHLYAKERDDGSAP
jgi:DNA-binding CsgD family transcriptional regulator